MAQKLKNKKAIKVLMEGGEDPKPHLEMDSSFVFRADGECTVTD